MARTSSKDAATILKSSKDPGATLKAFLEEYQLTPAKLAETVKLSQSSIRQITLGKMPISTKNALKFAKAFGVAPEEWLDVQRRADLAEAKGDPEFAAALKEISKLKKPAPGKEPALDAAPKRRGRRSKAEIEAAEAAAAAEAPAPKRRGRKPKNVEPVVEPQVDPEE